MMKKVTLVYENIERHSVSFVRPESEDIHALFMEQRRQEYLKNPWTRDVWEEELTRYLDKNEREYADVMESMDKIAVNSNNAAIMAPVLVNRKKHKKYEFKEYMHKNWDKNKL